MEPVDFEVLEEGWNVVELEDGSIVKTRPVALFIFETETEAAEPEFRSRWQQQMGVWGAEKGEPSGWDGNAEALESHIVEENLSYRFLKRGESIYKVAKGHTLRLQVRPLRFDRTDLFDGDGEPIFSVEAELNLDVDPTG